MRSKLKEVEDTLTAFIEDDGPCVLVIAVAEEELATVFKIIEGLDDQDRANVYSIFPQEASTPKEYADAIVTHLQQQLDPVNTMRVAAGQPAWPPLPATCTDRDSPPFMRLRAAIAHARDLVPTERGNRLVWSLLPVAVPDPKGYAEVVQALLVGEGCPDWLRGVRLIVRDDRLAPALLPELYQSGNPNVLIYEPDLSAPAMMDAMASEVADPKTPEARRMELLLQLAALDYAHGRLDESAKKYGILHTYYKAQKAPEMEALTLSGIGDVLRRSGQLATARERYGQGLTVALQTQSLPLIMNLTIATGDVSMELTNYTDAEEHWMIGLDIARALCNVFVQADLMEKIGTARKASGKVQGAIEVWRDGVEVSRGVNYQVRERSLREHLLVATGSES